jgi:hypothetical protein
MFGIAERQARSVARADSARQCVLAWLAHPGVVLTGPAAVAWATGGVAPPVDRTASVDLVWVVITPSGSWLVTTNVEAERIKAEYDPAAHGFSGVAQVAWRRESRGHLSGNRRPERRRAAQPADRRTRLAFRRS